MSRVTWSWLAGFTDGDGCIYVPRKSLKRNVGPSQIKLTWYQKKECEWLLDEISNFLFENGIETVRYYHTDGVMVHLRTRRMEDTQAAISRIKKFLVLKREKAESAIDLYENPYMLYRRVA